MPANLPDEIVVDVTPLNIGDKLEVSTLRNDQFTILHPDNMVVAVVKMLRTAMKRSSENEEESENKEANE